MSRVMRLFLPVLSFAFGIAVMLLFFHHGVAHAASLASPAPAASGFDWGGAVALIAAIGVGVGAVLGGAAAILHALAARTKNATYESIAVSVDHAHDKLDQVLRVVGGLVPATGVPTPTSEKPTAPATPQSVVSLAKAPAMLLVLLLGALAAPALIGCAAVKTDAAAIAAGVVTCAKADVPAAKALGLQLGTEALGGLLGGKTQAQIWAQVSADAESAAKAQGLTVAACGFGGLVADIDKLLHPAPAPGTATQGLTASATVDPLAGGRAALAAFAVAHQIVRIDP